MEETTVRITKIKLEDFKNVEEGTVLLENSRKDYQSSVIGIYGQNGSGKTAIVDALELLRCSLSGIEVPNKFGDFITLNKPYSTITYDFSIRLKRKVYEVIYQLSIQKKENKVVIFNEILKCPIFSENQFRNGKLIDTSEDLFIPIARKKILIGNDKDVNMNLLVEKRLASETSRSFLFSSRLIEAIEENKKLNGDLDNEVQFYENIIKRITYFGKNELFVISTQNYALISLDAQPFAFKYQNREFKVQGTMALPLDYSVVIPEKESEIIEKIFLNVNIVLEKIIPGLNIRVHHLGNQLMEDGENGSMVQLMSCRNDKLIPLKYESEGIKKIVSILQLLIVVYNQPSITLVIDELDSSIFEYLLGEILRIISQEGLGQLIFTSHNLRPLETIDRGCIVFTTTNPTNRYVRLANVKDTHNLRDFYYRDIILGNQKEQLYESTKNSEISFAFREGGEVIE